MERARTVSMVCLFLMVGVAGCMEASSLDDAEVRMPDGPYSREECEGRGQLQERDLYVSTGSFEPRPGHEIGFFRFGPTPDGPWTVPGPEIRIQQCDTLRLRLHDPDGVHTIHSHGQSVPWAMDGVPFMTQAMEGGTFVYEYQAFEAGTYWYHCHFEAPAHVDAGLFGALIVEPLAPDMHADREYVMILHEADSAFFPVAQSEPIATDGHAADRVGDLERSVYSIGTIADLNVQGLTGQSTGMAEGPRDYHPAPSIRYRPYYDTFMINGKSYPYTEPVLIKEEEVVRIRMIHAGSMPHTMHLHGHHFLVTHKDGFPLEHPYWADSLLIGSGERYDFYVRGDNPGIWDFHDHGGGWGHGGYAANDYAFPGGMSTVMAYEDFPQSPPTHVHGQAGDYIVHAPSYRQ